jgi:hypothetical protein
MPPKPSLGGYRCRGTAIFVVHPTSAIPAQMHQPKQRQNGRPMLFQVGPPVNVHKTPRGAIENGGFVHAEPRHNLQL